MSRYKVTIGGAWSVEVEAEDRSKARYAGIHILQQAFPGRLSVETLLGATRAKALPTYTAFDTVPEDDKQWFVGFVEGDGWIGTNQGYLRLEIYQKDPQVLIYIKDLLNLEEPVRLPKAVHALVICSQTQAKPLLQLIAERVVLPHRIDQLKHVLKTEVVSHVPTWPWLAGFYDAEGYCADGNGTFQISIGQKDPKAVRIIRDFVGHGKIYDHAIYSEIRWWGEKAYNVYQNLRPFLRNVKAIYRLEALRIFLKKGGDA